VTYPSDRTIHGTPRIPLQNERQVAVVRRLLRPDVDEIRRTNWNVWLVTRDPEGMVDLLNPVRGRDEAPAHIVASALLRHGRTL